MALAALLRSTCVDPWNFVQIMFSSVINLLMDAFAGPMSFKISAVYGIARLDEYGRFQLPLRARVASSRLCAYSVGSMRPPSKADFRCFVTRICLNVDEVGRMNGPSDSADVEFVNAGSVALGFNRLG